MKKIFGLVITVLFVLVLLGSFCLAAAGSVYYVATNGNDSNPGTITQPWRTLQKAATVAVGGDTITIRGGTYYTDPVECNKTASSTARIVFQGYSGESVVLDGSNTTNINPDIFTVTGQYYDFKNMELRNAKRIGINMWGGKHVQISNCVIHDCYKGAVYSGNGALDVKVDSCTIYHNVHENDRFQYNHSGGWAAAINLGNTGTDSAVTNCSVYENWGEGIIVGGRISGNTVHDNYSVDIYVCNSAYATIEQNFVYCNGNTSFYRMFPGDSAPSAAVGIQVSNEGATHDNRGNKIINNIVIGNTREWHFTFWSGSGGALTDDTIANNVFVGGNTRHIFHIDSAYHANTLIANNIMYKTTGSGTIDGNWNTRGGITFKNNCIYGAPAGNLAGTGDVYSNPQLVNATGTGVNDFKLQGSSPCINAGATIAVVTNDYFGNSRSGAFDIGAHEYNGVIATPTFSPTPSSTPTSSVAGSPSPSPTATSTNSVAPTSSPTATPTASSVGTPTATPTPSAGSGTNVALNKTATADKEDAWNQHQAYRANDGSTSTYWDAGDISFPHWLKIDLGANYNLTRTEIMWKEINSAYKYKVEVSTDNTNWTLKVDKTGNTTRTQTNIDYFTATARYVRVTITGSSDWYATCSVLEFRIFN